MRILILNTDYMKFLRALYFQNPNLEKRSYEHQLQIRNASLFGVADFYSRNLRSLGHDAEEVHVNNRWLQYAWAREHGVAVVAPPPPLHGDASPKANLRFSFLKHLKPLLRPIARRAGLVGLAHWEAAILRAQIEAFEPDVVLNHDPAYIDSHFLGSVKRKGCVRVGQIASPLPPVEAFWAYDFMISSLPNFVQWFRARRIPATLSRLAFEPSVLNSLALPPPRDIELSFVGSLSVEHASRIEFLEHVARNAPLKVWGNGIDRLPSSSPLRACFQGEAWGSDMYNVLRRSRITLNKHIDLSEDMANNMRLYEATGMGALLLTDTKRNLHDIFDAGNHVVTYETATDCLDQIHYYLANEQERAKIAAAGQAHVMAHHNYRLRMKEFVEIVGEYQTRGSRNFL